VRILIVDDHAQNRYFLERLFAANGHECVSAQNGQAALDVLRGSKFDAIVSDVLMPEMDGFQLCRETRRDIALRATPFIFYTATYTDTADREFGLSLGASAYVVKPSEPEDILAAVASATRPAVPEAVVAVDSDTEFYRGYNPRLVRKLEQKVLEFEESQRALLRSNEALREEVKRRGTAESALGDSLALFEATVASTADGILACDRYGRVIALNAQFLSAWRMSSSESTASFADVKTQLRIKVAKVEQLDSVMVLGEQVEPASGVFVLRDGGELELRRRPLMVGGNVVGQVWSCTNTTERRLAELRELELQRRLWDAQKLTDLGLLAAGIAHDFNNVLTVIRGSVDAAQAMLDADHPLHEILNDVELCSDTGAMLVAQILEFSRREREAATPQNLGKLVKGSMRLLKLMAPRSVELHLQLEDTQAQVIVHPAQLTQILLNLGVNALQAVKGRGRITVGVSPVSEYAKSKGGQRAGEFVELRVSDSGVGMDEAVATRLFEPFFTTKSDGKGSGIGLATVHQIVADLGGWIVVESALGKGTVFRVVLPTSAGEQQMPFDPAFEARSTLPGAPPPTQPSQGTILVVEPDTDKRTVLVKCLTDAGYVVLALGDGPAAIEVMGQEPERYVATVIGEFSDSDLTCEVARVLRALSPNTAVVLTSFADYARFLAVSTNTSRCAVLSRPYRAETVIELFRTIMANPSSAR
jgi:two-component system, cell cycle sensor histidine kinase and response regulator CckA